MGEYICEYATCVIGADERQVQDGRWGGEVGEGCCRCRCWTTKESVGKDGKGSQEGVD